MLHDRATRLTIVTLVVHDDLELVLVKCLRESPLLLLQFIHLQVKLLPVVLLQVVLDRAQNSCEGLSVKFQKLAAIRFYSNAERPLLVIDQGKLSEMLSTLEGSYQYESFSGADLMELQAIDISIFNDIELFSVLSFFEDKFSFVQGNLLETINKFQFLELVQRVEKFDLVQKSCLEASLLNAALDGDCLKYCSVQSVRLAGVDSLNGCRSLVVVQESQLSES